MQDNIKSVATIVREQIAIVCGDPGMLPDLAVTLDALDLDSLDIVQVEINLDDALGGFALPPKFWDNEGNKTVGDFIAMAEEQARK